VSSRALAVALVLAVTSLAAPSAVRADDLAVDDRAAARAKKLYAEGDKLFNLGKFAAALVKFEKAYEAKPIPGLLFNIGQCHRNLDDYDAAIFSFRKYLKLLPDAANRDAVLEYIDELEREKQKKSSSDLSLIAPDTDTDRQVDKGPGKSKPIYKKWWFWGGIAAVGAGVTGALVLSGGGGPPSTGLGNVDFGK
jgi:tetratricopeptide (TPR) repeat protein